MIRLLFSIFILLPHLFLSEAFAQEVKCPKGYQPYANRCITQRMADYISCIEASGGNRQEISEEVSNLGREQRSTGVKASGSGAIISGSGGVVLDKASEKTLASKLETKWFQKGMDECRKVLDGQRVQSRHKSESINDKAMTPNLKIEGTVNSYARGSDDVKDKVDLVFRNMGSSSTAIMSIDLRTKAGAIFRTIRELDDIKLPLNIESRKAGNISFWLKKGEREQLGDIVVTDMDDNKIITNQTWNVYVEPKGIAMIASVGAINVHVSQNVKVGKNEVVPVFGGKLSILVKSIETDKSSSGLVVDAALSAPNEIEKIYSAISKGQCLPYGGYGFSLISVQPDSADFSVSDTPCK